MAKGGGNAAALLMWRTDYEDVHGTTVAASGGTLDLRNTTDQSPYRSRTFRQTEKYCLARASKPVRISVSGDPDRVGKLLATRVKAAWIAALVRKDVNLRPDSRMMRATVRAYHHPLHARVVG